MKTHLDLYKTEINSHETNTDEWKSLEDFDSCMKESAKKNLVEKPSANAIELQAIKRVDDEGATSQKSRKSLSLPLKSLTSDSVDQVASPVAKTKYSGGVPLTPLMSKLSVLAMEEKLSGYSSRDATPSEYKDFMYTPSGNYSFVNSVKKFKVEPRRDEEGESKELQKCVLFVCGQQDMVVNVLLEEEACKTPEVVNKLVSKGLLFGFRLL